mgnify:CR=1 FL=1
MDSYLLLKALHIIAWVCWFAGLFYLPRLLVYHATHAHQPTNVKMLRTMARKLYRYIMGPALVATLLTGVLLVGLNPGWLSMGWLHAKLMLVLGLTGFHFYLGHQVAYYAAHPPQHSPRFWRWVNEIPTVILITVVGLAVLKPF